MLRCRYLVPLTLAILWVASCQPPGERELSRRSFRIINGTTDTSAAHQAVIELDYTQWSCSGTLIASNYVMTAGHCCEGASASGFTVNFGNSTSSFTASRGVTKVNLDGFNSQTLTNDICLLQLSSAAPSSITPIPYLPTSLKLTSADVGTMLDFVGFGLTDASDQNSFGTKMKVNEALGVVCESSSCNIPNTSQGQAVIHSIGYDESTGGACEGDSGGPAFITRSGKEYVVGVTSYGDQTCADYGVSTNATDFASWIDSFIGTTDPCQGVTCSGHGTCTSAGGTASCQCNSGYHAVGLTCVADPKALGASCGSGSECQSNYCVDTVCCSTSSCSTCNTCANNTTQPGVCHAAPDNNSCSDGNACTSPDTCQGGSCVGGPALNCDDANPCTTDTCNASTGCVHTPAANGASCSDNNVCNGLETCQSGVCQAGTTLDCNDNNPCTTDVCDALNGCLHIAMADGTSCGGGVCGAASCQGGTCILGSNTCDDSSACTVDTCDPVQGCQHTAINCDDGNVCTQDTCSPSSGCQHTPVSDGTSCGGGVCGAASCSGGLCLNASGGLSCDDQNPCTADTCNPSSGCMHTTYPDGYPCGDCVMCMSGTCTGQVQNCSSGSGCGTAGGAGWGGLSWLLLAAAGMLAIRRKARP